VWASVASAIAANALDVHSWWGKYESNPVLPANSTFGGRGSLVKASLHGGLLSELRILRGNQNPKLRRVLSMVNFSISGLVGQLPFATTG